VAARVRAGPAAGLAAPAPLVPPADSGGRSATHAEEGAAREGERAHQGEAVAEPAVLVCAASAAAALLVSARTGAVLSRFTRAAAGFGDAADEACAEAAAAAASACSPLVALRLLSLPPARFGDGADRGAGAGAAAARCEASVLAASDGTVMVQDGAHNTAVTRFDGGAICAFVCGDLAADAEQPPAPAFVFVALDGSLSVFSGLASSVSTAVIIAGRGLVWWYR
jgi:hypothetical protein